MIAHEIGHHDLHPDRRLDSKPIRYATTDGPQWDCGYSRRSLVEAQADAYAAEFLCAVASMTTMLGGGDPSPTALAGRLKLERRLVLDQAARTLLPAGVDDARGIRNDATKATSLSAEQKIAIDQDKPVLVEGTTGSGKTTVLETIALVLARDGSAASTAIVAASEHAARIFQQRMAASAPLKAPMMWIGTARSLALEIVSRHAVRLGLAEDFLVTDKIAAGTLRYGEAARARIPISEVAAAALRIVTENSDVVTLLGRRFGRILVDDCQETDTITTGILRALARAGAQITAAGDLGHAARRHAGADPDDFQKLMVDLGAVRCGLTFNFRNASEIAAACASFRSGGSVTLNTGAKVCMSRVGCVEALAAKISEEASRLAAQGIALRDQVILARTHAELKLVRHMLEEHGFPVLHFGEHVDRVEVRDLLAVARLFEPSNGGGDLVRVASLPSYRCPVGDSRHIEAFAHRRRIPVKTALAGLEKVKDLSREGRNGMVLLRRHLNTIAEGTLYERLVEWIFASGYLEASHLRPDTGALARLAAYHALAVARGMEGVDDGGAQRFEARLRRIGSLELTCDFARFEADACAHDVVSMMTMHASQGRTFECVHVILPSGPARHRRSPTRDDEAVNIALSRARQHLHVLESLKAHRAHSPASRNHRTSLQK